MGAFELAKAASVDAAKKLAEAQEELEQAKWAQAVGLPPGAPPENLVTVWPFLCWFSFENGGRANFFELFTNFERTFTP